MQEYLKSLNEEQLECVLHEDGPLLILAGPGSGKTRVITLRIAYLVKTLGVNPKNILAFTFTNKAAKEIKQRVSNLVDANSSKQITIDTFHTVCARILRIDGYNLGYKRYFSIVDKEEGKRILRRFENRDNWTLPEDKIMNKIEALKNQLISAHQYKDDFSHEENYDTFQEAYLFYEKYLLENNSMDLNDLIIKCIELFQQFPQVLEKYQNLYKYIHVDEYQDTNYAQYLFTKLLANRYENIVIVGDPDQSIYGWRGANIDNIFNFASDFKNTKQINLNTNYRSTKTILDASNSLIKHNQKRMKKKSKAFNDGQGEKITFKILLNEKQESEFIASEIKRLVKHDIIKYSDVAIFYRNNEFSRNIEEALVKRKIPYYIKNGIKFYNRKEIKDVVAYLQLALNPDNDLEFRRVINTPKRGIGPTTIKKIQQFATENNLSLFKSLEFVDQIFNTPITLQKLQHIYKIISEIEEVASKQTHNIYELFNYILDATEIISFFRNNSSNAYERREENIKEFGSYIKAYVEDEMNNPYDMGEFLQNSLLDSFDTDIDEQGVTLLTLHSSKGLEFDTVFIAGMEEDIFPSYLSLENGDIEEERRLAFVGYTRAERKLYLTATKERILYGRKFAYNISRFVNEIPRKYLDYQEYESPIYKSTNNVKEKSKDNVQIGDVVSHIKFGEGKINTIEIGINDKKYAKIFFEEIEEEKKILLDHPSVTII